jgi:hypothetical protein
MTPYIAFPFVVEMYGVIPPITIQFTKEYAR